jgi:hypothetical protein
MILTKINDIRRDQQTYPLKRILVITVMLFCFWGIPAAEGQTKGLPFDRGVINRYSLDGLPRSISIRQGRSIWLGYDLERATPRKVWRAPKGKSGLAGSLTTRSVGTALFEDKSDDGWKLQQSGKRSVPLRVRYLGCTQREGYIELSWELRHESRKLRLRERVSTSGAGKGIVASRALQVEGLNQDESLALPATAGAAWRTSAGKAAMLLAGDKWIRIDLP